MRYSLEEKITVAGILEGIKILEMGQVVAVPAACATLADWGAEVLKIEPLSGEMGRRLKKFHGVSTTVKLAGGEMSWYVQMLNRNKKGLAVDLKKEAGRDILYKLIQKYDVFVSNYELASLKRLKLDYDTLSQLNPGLIYGVLTGYGTAGPDKDERGFDYAAAWARSGGQYQMSERGSPPPPQRGGMMDMTVAAHIVGGILAALLHREKTGKGQELEFSLYHTGVWTLSEDIQAALVGTPLPRQDRTKEANPLSNSYRTKDDRWFQLAILQSDTQWFDFCRAISKPELENDIRFNNMDMREEHCEELIRILDEIFASKDRDEWEKCFRENNCIYGRIDSPTEVINDPQAIANDFFTKIHHPLGGEMKVITTPIKFYQNPASVRNPAPEIGQHTEETLLDLGYTQDDISELIDQGVIL